MKPNNTHMHQSHLQLKLICKTITALEQFKKANAGYLKCTFLQRDWLLLLGLAMHYKAKQASFYHKLHLLFYSCSPEAADMKDSEVNRAEGKEKDLTLLIYRNHESEALDLEEKFKTKKRILLSSGT